MASLPPPPRAVLTFPAEWAERAELGLSLAAWDGWRGPEGAVEPVPWGWGRLGSGQGRPRCLIQA